MALLLPAMKNEIAQAFRYSNETGYTIEKERVDS